MDCGGVDAERSLDSSLLSSKASIDAIEREKLFVKLEKCVTLVHKKVR